MQLYFCCKRTFWRDTALLLNWGSCCDSGLRSTAECCLLLCRFSDSASLFEVTVLHVGFMLFCFLAQRLMLKSIRLCVLAAYEVSTDSVIKEDIFGVGLGVWERNSQKRTWGFEHNRDTINVSYGRIGLQDVDLTNYSRLHQPLLNTHFTKMTKLKQKEFIDGLKMFCKINNSNLKQLSLRKI